MIDRPLPGRPDEGAARRLSRRLLPAAAASVLFVGAFGVGMATKSSSTPQTATSLASPVSIQAPQVTVPALLRDVPTPALKSQPAPVGKHPAPPATTPTTPAATTPAIASPRPSLAPSPPPAPQTPPARVIHGQSGGSVSSSGGGGSVVHGGN